MKLLYAADSDTKSAGGLRDKRSENVPSTTNEYLVVDPIY